MSVSLVLRDKFFFNDINNLEQRCTPFSGLFTDQLEKDRFGILTKLKGYLPVK
jgi:hypothetical protein